ncbi:MAG: GntR family transcriptional regulator [Alphaproteobacteria bacterium]|nr:GntR family transcriptional regulator [Alphaproteobacteria bacterium]
MTVGTEDTHGQEGGTLASVVYDRMRSDILNGELGPGERLRADFLRQRYAVGNSPVREALNRLSADGLVVREDQKGFRVSAVSKDDMLELAKTRNWIEEIALVQSIEQGGVAWEEDLVLAFHRLTRAIRDSDATDYAQDARWEQCHRAFHMTLIGACASRWLLQFAGQLTDQSDRYWKLAGITNTDPGNDIDEHRAIMEAAIDRRADDAVTLLQNHCQKVADLVLESKSRFFSGHA